MGTQEDMYCNYKTSSDRPEINFTLYNVHRANIIEYSDCQKSLHFIANQKLPVQNMVTRESTL
jgi:hypothetical protein